MAEVAEKHSKAFRLLVTDIECFSMEDRRRVQDIVTELHQRQTETIENILAEDGITTIKNMLTKYKNRGRCAFVGNYLRMYTDSQTLVASWLSLENMKLLFSAVADGDFGVEADAIQTLQVSCLSIVMFNTTILTTSLSVEFVQFETKKR